MICESAVRRLAHGPLWMSIEDYEEPKTNPQLDHIHAIIKDFAIHQQISEKHAKARAKIYLNYYEMVETKEKGEIPVLKSFGKASKKLLSEFIEQLIALAFEYGVELRHPQWNVN